MFGSIRWCVWSFRPSSPLRLPHLEGSAPQSPTFRHLPLDFNSPYVWKPWGIQVSYVMSQLKTVMRLAGPLAERSVMNLPWTSKLACWLLLGGVSVLQLVTVSYCIVSSYARGRLPRHATADRRIGTHGSQQRVLKSLGSIQ